MRTQFAAKLLSATWHIFPAHGREAIGSMLARIRGTGPRLETLGERPSEDPSGQPLPKMQVVGDVALIPIRGVLMIGVPDWAKRWGCITDADDIAGELAAAVANPQVNIIVLDVDSPGGWSIAGDKLYEIVESAARKKPVFTWCADGSHICSSAYEAAAPSIAIYAGRHTAGIGCIGSLLVYLDDSEFWAQMGIRWEVFRSGEYKGLGEGALSESHRAFLQGIVDEAGARFRRNVSKYRRDIAAEDMQGQWYSSAEASKRGFIWGTATDLGDAISKFRRLI